MRFFSRIICQDVTPIFSDRYFVNFAKRGDPNGTELPQWPQFDPARFDLMMFTRDDGTITNSK